jgi:hypothetical protein
MKRLLREKKSGLYYKAAGKWTPDRKYALEFKDNQSAINCGLKLKDRTMELVLRFAGYGRDVAFPLKQPKSALRSRSDSPVIDVSTGSSDLRRGVKKNETLAGRVPHC